MPRPAELAPALALLLLLVATTLVAGGCAERGVGIAPALVASEPADGEVGVGVSGWLQLEFAAPVSANARRAVGVVCDGEALDARVLAFGPNRLLVAPADVLPPAADCTVRWRAATGPRAIGFTTAPVEGAAATVLYDRTDPARRAPFPDDFWRVERRRVAGKHLEIELEGFNRAGRFLIDAVLAGTRDLDGFSPVAHVVVELSDPVDPASVPRTPGESVDPLASVGLFDLTLGSPSYGARVPFRLQPRTDTSWGYTAHSLLLFPTGSLRPGGHYGVVVTRRALTADGRPFGPSAFFRALRDGAPSADRARASDVVERLRGAREAMDGLAREADPPLPREEIAFVVTFTVRSAGVGPRDLVEIRKELRRMPPPAVHVERVEAEDPAEAARGSAVAAVVHGTFEAPDWRDERRLLARDGIGRPRRRGAHLIPFVLALPDAARERRVPVVVYQHGNPGSAEEEVVDHARHYLARAGFAVIGFTDTLNREVSPPGRNRERRAHDQVVDILWRLVLTGRLPEYFLQTNAEQLTLLRAIPELARIEQFAPGGDASGEPLFGIDGDAPPAYVGVSEGANHGPALLSVAPEVRAAVLVAGGRRFSEVLIHQQPHTFLAPLFQLGFEQFTPTDIWILFSIFQTLFDAQDGHSYAPFLYRQPVEIDGSTRRASILLQEGVDDSVIPNHVTESLALTLGPVPQVAPIARRSAFLARAETPLAGNVDEATTAGLSQFAPVGVPGVEPTPGCLSPPVSRRTSREGHLCVQSADEALRQRIAFLRSALAGDAPVIIDPQAPAEPLANERETAKNRLEPEEALPWN